MGAHGRALTKLVRFGIRAGLLVGMRGKGRVGNAPTHLLHWLKRGEGLRRLDHGGRNRTEFVVRITGRM